MVNKLRKTPSGSPLPTGRASPIGRAEAQPRVKPTRTRSFTDSLGGLRLRAAATQVNESLSSLRRSGSAHLKSVLRRRHSAPPDTGHDAHADAIDAGINPDALHPQPGQPWVKHFVIDGERYMQHGNGIPQRVPQVPPARPPLDAAGMLRADLGASHLQRLAKQAFDAPWLARQRERAVQHNDANALRQQREFLDRLHVDTIRLARGLNARFAGRPFAAETAALIDRAEVEVALQVSRERLAVIAAEKRLRPGAPPLPPRPNVHELP